MGEFEFLGGLEHSQLEDIKLQVPKGPNGESPIWYHDDEGVTHVDMEPGPYLPTWYERRKKPVANALASSDDSLFRSL